MASTSSGGTSAGTDGRIGSGGGSEMGSQSSGTKEGWLEKKGDVNTNWRERWFTLGNGQLDYYVDKDKTKRKGTIMMNEITEIGPLQHDSRPFCFGLNSGKRLWSLSAKSAEVRDQWISALRTYQPKSLEGGSKVPSSAYGSIKKTLLKKNKTESSETTPSTVSSGASSSTAPSNSGNTTTTTATTNPTSPRTAPAPGSPPSSSGPNSDASSSAPVNVPRPAQPISSGAPTSAQLSTSPAAVIRSTTQIISNEPRATMLQPTAFAAWNPKLAWPPTPERPAWCYELAPNLPPELTAWLSPLLSAATRFNMGWAFVLDWVRRIGNPSFSNVVILESIKQGLNKLTPCWTEFDKAAKLAETWDVTHNAVGKLRNQIVELHGLVDAKVAGWHVQLADKKAEENQMEFTYKRQDSGTPERPAWFFIPRDAGIEVGEAFKIFERAATIFNDNWQIAFEAAKSISATNRQAAPSVKEAIVKALSSLEPSWKEFDAAISSFESWNALSLYTLEVKQHVAGLKRLHDSHKRDWLSHLDSRTSFVPSNKSDYLFEADRASTADRPAWVFKFNLQTPSEISRGLLTLSTAANIFNSNWAIAYEWANKIGKNMATRAAIREGILGSFKTLENAWPHFESAITMLEPWETAATDIIRQVSQLRGLVEESREAWLGKLATSQEIAISPIGDNFRLSGFGTDPTGFDAVSTPVTPNGSISGSQPPSFSPFQTFTPSTPSNSNDSRSIYENALAASREAASISDMPDAKLNFVPGLGPGSFKNCDIYRFVLKELYRAQQLPDVQADVLEKIRALIVETQQRHRALCFKWALHFAKEGVMPRSLEYYEALHEVLPDACAELDKELMSLKAEFSAHDTGSMSLGSLN